MGKLSQIEWTHHTFNPWLGCVEVSPACDHCYARTLVTGRMQLPVWGKDAPRKETSANYWRQPFAWDRAAAEAGERHRVFCGSLCDVMEDRRDLDRLRGDLRCVIESTPNLDWLLLTKRPQNFRKFLPPAWIEKPRPNVWGMTTVESADYLWRVSELLATPFAVRGLSVEPLLGPLDLTAIRCGEQPSITHNALTGTFSNVPFTLYPRYGGGMAYLSIETKPRIDWVIGGGESGKDARPMEVGWLRALRDQCIAACVPFFFKQWGDYCPFDQLAPEVRGGLIGPGTLRAVKRLTGRLLDGRQWNEFPIRSRVLSIENASGAQGYNEPAGAKP